MQSILAIRRMCCSACKLVLTIAQRTMHQKSGSLRRSTLCTVPCCAALALLLGRNWAAMWERILSTLMMCRSMSGPLDIALHVPHSLLQTVVCMAPDPDDSLSGCRA